MTPQLQLYNVVALTVDVPEEGVYRGQVGTVTEILDEGVFEVEFSDLKGIAYAMVPLHADQLLILHYTPASVS